MLKVVQLPAGTLAVGKKVKVQISAIGTTIVTKIDGVTVDTSNDSTFRSGQVGVRTWGAEAATYDNTSVTAANGGASLMNADYTSTNPFSCGTVSAGVLNVSSYSTCLLNRSEVDDGWNDYTLKTDLTVRGGAAGVRFRALDGDDSYMWQFTPQGQIREHIQVAGVFSVIRTVNLPMGLLSGGNKVNVEIRRDCPGFG